MKDEGVLLVEILHEGMKAHAARIPAEEQCKRCRGRTLIHGGHSMPPSVYSYETCPSCDGTGHKENTLQKVQERAGGHKLPTTEEAKVGFHEAAKKYK